MVLRFSLTVFMLVYSVVSPAHGLFYRAHPELIQVALMRCPAVPPKQMSCEKLKVIAQESMSMLLALERNPQQYGLDIMQLQAALAKQENKGAKRGMSQQDLARIQANLVLRLALILSLESPEGLG